MLGALIPEVGGLHAVPLLSGHLRLLMVQVSLVLLVFY